MRPTSRTQTASTVKRHRRDEGLFKGGMNLYRGALT